MVTSCNSDVNCETDFVGNGEELRDFADRLANALTINLTDVEAIMALEDAASEGKLLKKCAKRLLLKLVRRSHCVVAIVADDAIGLQAWFTHWCDCGRFWPKSDHERRCYAYCCQTSGGES